MPKLILVPTPIGNLKDITYRAVEVLGACDFVICEDTRVSGRLLQHYNIQKKLVSFNVVNEHKLVDKMVKDILHAETVCFVSDAGTPAISDPGFLLVRACIELNIDVECLPGATAFVPALVVSGFPMHSFIFEGFLPHKKGKQTAIKALIGEERTVIFYESPHRLINTLNMMAELLEPGRRVCVARELSKMFEEIKRGTAAEVLAHFTAKEVKGEIVLIVAPNE
ncbi:MAG TPA: 16S rRNA (cytidine(1402)-2'-O)-methyltransferase [Flavobacteriales bacterium]|nr:16S rRNA (cytidine(1402)-2'-O)-methyltransferase [Flavobacteriales bacterium]